MLRIHINKKMPKVVLPNHKFDLTANWIGNENGHALLRFKSKIGITCLLNISKELRGSIFEFTFKGKRLDLVVESITTCNDEITAIVLLID